MTVSLPFRNRPGAAALALLAATAVAGCETGGVIASRPIPESSALILSADNRAIIVSGPRETGVPITCAEPQPDAIRAVAQELAAALTAKGVLQGAPGAEASAGVSAAAREAVAELGRRTPTIQLMRDALYRACEAVMNGVFDTSHVPLIATRIDNVMIGLHAIDGLTSLGRSGGAGAAISASATGGASAGGPGGGTATAPTSTVTVAPGAQGTAGSLDDRAVAAIASAVTDIVRQSLGANETLPAPAARP
jgi:hypothetical protein